MKETSEIFQACEFRILSALRRITRAIDIHSRQLHMEHGITTPQLICIHALSRNEGISLSKLSKLVGLNDSTVNGIVDRLESKGLLTRCRSSEDRRKILLHTTDEGRRVTEAAPSLLQHRLAKALQSLPELEQLTIAMSLERIVGLMEVQHIDASPNLLAGRELQSFETKGADIPAPSEEESPGEAASP